MNSIFTVMSLKATNGVDSLFRLLLLTEQNAICIYSWKRHDNNASRSSMNAVINNLIEIVSDYDIVKN